MEEDKAEKCTLCLEYLLKDLVCIIGCSHVFHQSCYESLPPETKLCPNCRHPFAKSKKKRIISLQLDASKFGTVVSSEEDLKRLEELQNQIKIECEPLAEKLVSLQKQFDESMNTYHIYSNRLQDIKDMMDYHYTIEEEFSILIKKTEEQYNRSLREHDQYVAQIKILKLNLNSVKNQLEEVTERKLELEKSFAEKELKRAEELKEDYDRKKEIEELEKEYRELEFQVRMFSNRKQTQIQTINKVGEGGIKEIQRAVLGGTGMRNIQPPAVQLRNHKEKEQQQVILQNHGLKQISAAPTSRKQMKLDVYLNRT